MGLKRLTTSVAVLSCIGLTLACSYGRAEAQEFYWRQVLADNSSFVGVECPDSIHCMTAVVHGGAIANYILKSEDAGLTWRKVYLDTGDRTARRFPLYLKGISYPDSLFAIVAADSGLVLRTTDGGVGWERVRVLETDAPCHQIAMYDRLHGTAAIGYHLMVTEDGGMNWREVFQRELRPEGWQNGGIWALRCVGPGSITAVLGDSLNPLFVRSDDFGRNWEHVLPIPDYQRYRLVKMSFGDGQRGWIAGGIPDPRGGLTLISRTMDGGRTWNLVHDRPLELYGNSALSMTFLADGNGVIGTYRQIWRTSNGGATWARDSIFGIGGEFTVCFGRGQRGVAVTQTGIYRYESLAGATPAASSAIGAIDIWPNPVRHNENLRLRALLPDPARASVSLISLLGVEVLSKDVFLGPGKPDTHTLSIRGLAPGLYQFRLTLEGGTSVTRPLIIE